MSIRLDTCRGCGAEPRGYVSVIDGWWFDWKDEYDAGNTWCPDCVKKAAPALANRPYVNLYEEEEN